MYIMKVLCRQHLNKLFKSIGLNQNNAMRDLIPTIRNIEHKRL